MLKIAEEIVKIYLVWFVSLIIVFSIGFGLGAWIF